MDGNPQKPLVIVITRVHASEGSSEDEYEAHWRGTQGKYLDEGRYDPHASNSFALLLVHGHHGLENHATLEEAINEILKPQGHEISTYNRIHVFAHTRQDVINGWKTLKWAKINCGFALFSSNGESRPACDLLPEIIQKEKDFQEIDKEELIECLREWMQGLQYKVEKIRQGRDCLFELGLLIESAKFLNQNRHYEIHNWVKAVESCGKRIREIIELPPLLLEPGQSFGRGKDVRREASAIRVNFEKGKEGTLFTMFGNEKQLNLFEDLKGSADFWGDLSHMNVYRVDNFLFKNHQKRKADKIFNSQVRKVLMGCSKSLDWFEEAFRKAHSQNKDIFKKG